MYCVHTVSKKWGERVFAPPPPPTQKKREEGKETHTIYKLNLLIIEN